MEKKKKNQVSAEFSTILCILVPVILLCAAAYGGHNPEYTIASTDTLNVGTGKDVERIDEDWLNVFGTVNLYPGAYVDYGIYAYDGSTVNIHAGELGTGSFIMLMGNNSTAMVTVYGTGFAVAQGLNGTAELLEPSTTQFKPLTMHGCVLTGTYGNNEPINLLFYSDVPIHLVNLDVEVEIDIKPGSNPNSINLKSRGVVPVAVFTIAGFDASTIDPGTVLFAGAEPVRCKLKDVDDDGDMDMLFHFKTQELELTKDSTEATLTGTTFFGGKNIELTDEVRIVPPKK